MRDIGRNDKGVLQGSTQKGGIRQNCFRRAVWHHLAMVAAFIGAYLLLEDFVVGAYRIPSASMTPTLVVGDWILVNRIVLGGRVPLAGTRLPSIREPRRNDVVVFVSPYQADEEAHGADPIPTLVKRIAGLPGDTLFMRDGKLYANGIEVLPTTVSAPRGDRFAGQPSDTNVLFAWQKQIEIRGSRFGGPPMVRTLDNWGPLQIPQGRFFVLGDNRYESKDSRFVGVVSRERLLGIPVMIYYSHRPRFESSRVMPSVTDIRWSRIGTLIH